MRLVFAGTPSPAVPSLRTLAAGEHEVAMVLTRPDAPLGRKRVLTPSPVAEAAERLALPVLRPTVLDAEVSASLAAVEPDLGVVVAYGKLLREPLLSVPRLGWINLHFSLLPRWRGAAPVQRALLAGDAVTGVSVFQLEAGMDTGPVYAREEHTIGRHETAGHLLGVLAERGAAVLARVVDDLADGTAVGVPQEGEPTLAPKLTLLDGAIDWRQSADRVLDRVRGATPEPGAYLMLSGERLKVHEAAPSRDSAGVRPGELTLRGRSVVLGTGTVPVELVVVQPSGRRAMAAAAWWRGLGGVASLSADLEQA
ncbi:MAG: fmt [Naasia sp.]|jgi:methionyl-tRNA formyltransferase|uniref:methionyl-tRNA formyltransferase n=1 Tax=Naasia sp. TaxID=2546198 RepID=UPI00260FAFB7|nr:methionyl-tRNA formyltransferase [Naasia sp.]MCU1569866.1 fmt [Naasia sp.]